jgi:hypothetical protein
VQGFFDSLPIFPRIYVNPYGIVFWTVNLFVMPIYPYSFTLPPVNKQDIPSDGVAGEFLGISAGGQLDWLPVSGGSGSGDLLAANNLSELTATAGTARTNLGLGTGDSPTFKNLTISTGSIATSAPVTISQTWNGTGSTVFTALKVDATTPGTTSAFGSLLLDLQLGGVSKFSVDKDGKTSTIVLQAPSFRLGSGSGFAFSDISTTTWRLGLSSSFTEGQIFSSGSNMALSLTANVIEARNSINPQTFNVYGTYSTSPSLAYSRLAIACDTSGNATLTTQSTGTAGTVSINGVPVGLGKGNVAGNVAVGLNTLATNTGTGNVAVGTDALPVQVAGNYNTAVGRVALYKNINGGYNTAIGNGALFSNLGGANNVAVGESALANSLGSFNIGLGMEAGASTFVGQNTTANSSIFLGFRTKALGNGESNQIVIGHDAIGLGSNTAVLGNASITTTALRGNVGIGTTAPSRPLTVVGNVSGVNLCLLQNTNSAGYTELAFDNDTAFAGNLGGFVFGLGGTTTPSPNEAYFFNRRSAAIFFGTNATERMRITAAGNVGIGTTAPSSKLHVVGDAVLTGQLLGSNYTVGTADSVTQANIAITNNHVGFADSAIVITPKGTGALILGPKPDGTATGGNARGINAVDLQFKRTFSSQVANGNYAVIAGGGDNRASGVYSFVGGGSSSAAGNNYSVVCGGLSNNANANNSFIGSGDNNTVTASHASVIAGASAVADRYAIQAQAAGRFSSFGDAQTTKAVFRNKTTTNSAVELFLDGTSARYTVTSGKVISMLINITGTKSDGSAVAHYVRQYSIKNVGGTTSQVYAPVTIGTDNAAGTSIALSANDTNDALKIEVTGVTSETWRWVASVDAVEVGYGV